MSLVIAKKDGNQLCIVSDTQLTYPDQTSRRNKTHPASGILKTIVLSPDLAVAFAGDVKFADLALQNIGTTLDVDKILETLQSSHEKSDHEIEFILTKCYANSPPVIYKIANGLCSEEDSAWLGDQEAFNLFQSYILHKPKVQKSKKQPVAPSPANAQTAIYQNFKIAVERNVSSDLFSKVSGGMDWVIDNHRSGTVGGFKVMVVFDKIFRYVSYTRAFNERLEFSKKNEFKIHASASHGGYSITFHGASIDYRAVALYVLQGNFGVVYERKDMGIHKPQIVNTDEAGFHSHLAKCYGIAGVFPNSRAAQRYYPEMWSAFDSQNWQKALSIINEAIPNNHGQLKAGLLFNRGITCLHLQQHMLALSSFKEALSLNPELYFKFRKALYQWRLDLDRSFGISRMT